MDKDEDYEGLLELIKAKRKEQGISQEKMAERLGLAKLTYQRYENGINPMPANIFIKASKILGVDLILRGSENKETSLITTKEIDINTLSNEVRYTNNKIDRIEDKLDELLNFFGKNKKKK